MDDQNNFGLPPDDGDPNGPFGLGPGDIGGLNLGDASINGQGVQLDENGNPIQAKTIRKRHKEQAVANMQGKDVPAILNLALRQQRADLSPYAIDSIPVEHRMVQDIQDMSPVLKDWVKKGDDVIRTYPQLSDDIMLSLYKPEPEMLLPDDMQNNFQVNHSIVDGLTGDPQYELLREYCQMDMFSSALASEIMHEKAIANLKDLKDEMDRKGGDNLIDSINAAVASQQDVSALIEKAQTIQQLQNQLNAAGQTSPQLNNQANKLVMDLANAMKIADATQKKLEKVISNQPDALQKIQKAMQSGVKSALTTITQVDNYINQWGFDPGSEVRISFESKMKAINQLRNSKKLKKFGDIIGALKEMARKEQKVKSKHGSSAITGVTIGSNLAHLLPSELMLLGNESTKKDFMKRYHENGLLQYEMTCMEKKGRGPLIVCVDVSGSMGGDPEVWSKSFAIALLDVAQIQKRNYCYISYDTRICDVFVQEKGYLDPAKVVEIAENFSGGGTNFEPPLEKALEMLKDSRFKKGDIVFITDGDSAVSEKFLKEFLKVKADKEFAVRGVIIDMGASHCTDSSVKAFADEVILLSTIADLGKDSTVAQQIFRDV